ncbi:MAG: PspA/IM30 family protein [Gammaproteobacteria bacterium]
MIESLTSRVGRLIAGSFHAIVDAVENAAPEATMEQAVREIDRAIADVRADLGHVEAQRHLTAKRLAEESGRHERLAEQAKLALDQGREDLATVAVERQIDIEAQIPVLEARLGELAEDKARLEGYVTALQAKRREMRDALADYVKARQQQASSIKTTGTDSAGGDSAQVRAERASDAFERVFQRQTGLKSPSASSDAAKLAELEELARKNRVAARLAELKAGDV